MMSTLAVPSDSPAGGADRPSGLAAVVRLVASSKTSLAGLVLLALFLAVAILAPLIAPYNPVEQSILLMNKGPSPEHWFGTDRFGRDVLSRVIWGTRPSLVLALVAPLISGALGCFIGMLAGYFGGWTDRVVTRLTDMLMAFPTLLLGILIAAALGSGFGNVVIAVAFAFLPKFVRVARGSTMAIRQEPFVEAAISVGQPDHKILLRHILPNISGPIVVVGTLWIATAIRVEATLSFLGLGIQAPSPSWGNIIRDGLGSLLSSPWPVVAAGAAITGCVLAFNLIGDALRDALDPELQA